jgi:hypothetical protein
MTTAAPSTETSSQSLVLSGSSLQPSEPVAVCPCSIPTGFSGSEESVRALTCLLLGLLRETLSGDAVYLSVMRAKTLARENGVSEQEFNRVAEIVVIDWHIKRKENPMSCLF